MGVLVLGVADRHVLRFAADGDGVAKGVVLEFVETLVTRLVEELHELVVVRGPGVELAVGDAREAVAVRVVLPEVRGLGCPVAVVVVQAVQR